jgi:YVTN family beta-propeller protein
VSISILLSTFLSTILVLSVIFSGVGVARADSVIATIPISPLQPSRVAFDSANGDVYVTDIASDTVSVIDGSTNKVIANIPVDDRPVGVAFDSANGDVYVANIGSGSATVSVIDGLTNQVIDAIPIGDTETGGGREVAFDSANGNLFVTNGNNVYVIDGSTNQVIGAIPVSGADQIAFDSANGNLYVTGGHETVFVIDGSTNQVIGNIVLGNAGGLTGVVFDSANRNIYAALLSDNSAAVYVIDGSTNQVIGAIPVSGPQRVTFDSANGDIYVTASTNTFAIVYKIDGSINKVVDTIPVGDCPEGLAFDSANNYIYEANACSNTISVIATTPPQQPPDTTVTSTVDGNGAIIQSGGTTFSTAIKFTYTAAAGTNSIAGFECNLDNGVFSSCLSPTTLTNLAVGKHTFQVRAIDTSGNRDPTPASFTWTIAAVTPPSHTTITSAVDGNGAGIPNGGTTTSDSITFTLSALAGTFPIAGFQCSLDNSQFSGCASPVTLHNLAAGSHKFVVVATDTAGNKDPNPVVFNWVILTPAQAIQQLIQNIQSMGLNQGTQTSLTAPLNAALFQLGSTSNNPNSAGTACNQLNAFVNHLNSNGHNGQLSSIQAAQILQSAQNIQKSLGCTGNGH